MAANIEEVNGVYSFAENGKKERAWHSLGQVFDRPMFVKEALEACNANYEVALQPVVALTPDIVKAIENGEKIDADVLLSMMIHDSRATMRLDTNKALGLVSKGYGIVQNSEAFSFVDTLCSGQIADRDKCPTIECCGVLGHGERVFITAKFPEPVVLNAKRNDIADVYVVFTTTHDGSGAVTCMVTPIRVVCENTLSMAFKDNSGKFSFRHTSNVMKRLDLMNEENTKFAYKALNLAEVYTNALKENYEHLRNIQLSQKQLNDIVAGIAFSDADYGLYQKTGNLYHGDIATNGKNTFARMMNCIEKGVGQDIIESGNGEWLINGVTSYYQNVNKYKDDEKKFDSIMDGYVSKKVQKAFDLILQVA